MEGLENVHVHQYTGIQDLKEHVKSQSEDLQAGLTNQQFLVFRDVTKRDLAKIDRQHSGIEARVSHYTCSNLLIIKLMPSVKHELAHLNLARQFDRAFCRMGLPDESLASVGARRFFHPQSSQEADAASKPGSRGN